jgi:hypothetical protein
MAGVTGPCPKCNVIIQAPLTYQQQSPIHLTQQGSAQSGHSGTTVDSYSTPQHNEAAVTRLNQERRTNIWPEPRQLPMRSESAEIPLRKYEQSGERKTGNQSANLPIRESKKNHFLRFLAPVVFLCTVVGVVYGMKNLLQQVDPKNKPNTSKTSSSEKVKLILPEDTDKTNGSAPDNTSDHVLSVEDPSMPDLSEGNQTGDSQINEPIADHGGLALELLERFLEMKDLEERLPHIETSLKREDLEETVLNRKLPDVETITVDVRETNAAERVTDFYYYVDFREPSGAINPQTMLVRKRGEQAPKVVVDPFLDLFGGRLEKFASEPSPLGEFFQVVICPGAFCYEEIPNKEKKFTLKILSREDTVPIALAYFGIQSKVGGMFAEESSGIAYGQSKPSTVYLRWNTQEDPARPYLEVLDIKALDWNP